MNSDRPARTPKGGRATTPPRPRPTPRPVTFPCPLCGGDAALTGRGADREFVCLDCTLFTVSRDD